MGRKSKKSQNKALSRAAYGAAHNQRFDSFEPNMANAQIRMRAAEDESVVVDEPMTAEEREQELQQCDARKQMLTVAMDPEAQKRQKQAFTGSVVQHTLQVAREAEKAKTHEMEQHEWTQWHEMMYAKHLPFSAACYKLFRRAAEGNALKDEEFVKNLLIGHMRECGIVSHERADKLASVHNTKTHMYGALRQNVEAARARKDKDNNEEANNEEANNKEDNEEEGNNEEANNEEKGADAASGSNSLLLEDEAK